MSRAAASVAATLFLIVGCRSVPTGLPLPTDDPRPASYLASFDVLADQRHSLRGVARVSLAGPAGESRSKQILVVARPARLRVEVQGFLNQLVAVLASDGERFELFRAEDRSVEHGAMHPSLLYQVAGLPLRPEDAVRVLLGVPPLGTDPLPGSALVFSDGRVRVDLVAEGGSGMQRVDFDEGAQLRRVAVHGVEGELLWSARYDDYRDVGDAPFAHDIALEFPLSGARAEVSFRQVELNPELPPGIFRLGLSEGRGGRG